jgi:hypothetical protein
MKYPDFEEFIASLNDAGARYLIVGAHALALHARPRFTKDLDVLVEPVAENAKRVQAALRAFFRGYDPGYSIEKLTNPRTLIIIGKEPMRIDVLTTIGGIESFEAAWGRRADASFGDAPAHYLSLDDLIAAKESAGRPQDLADLVPLRHARERLQGAPPPAGPPRKPARPRRGR